MNLQYLLNHAIIAVSFEPSKQSGDVRQILGSAPLVVADDLEGETSRNAADWAGKCVLFLRGKITFIEKVGGTPMMNHSHLRILKRSVVLDGVVPDSSRPASRCSSSDCGSDRTCLALHHDRCLKFVHARGTTLSHGVDASFDLDFL